jgi:hypothetical protein
MSLGLIVVLLAALLVLGGCEKSAPGKKDKADAVTPPKATTYEWPYTGMETTDAAIIKNRPLSVKIENSAEARPQTGLNSADVVYETMVEGGETRLNCIFQSSIPEEVGPVRSGRLSDLWIVPQYQGLFLYAGGNDEFKAGMRASDIADMTYSVASELFYRVNFRAAPHNLYLTLNKSYEKAKEMGFETQSDTLVPLKFGTSDIAPTSTASAVSITYAGYSKARWDWDAERKVYLRTQTEGPHMDAATEEQVFTTNIVVIVAEYTQRSALDPAGSPTYDITLGGTGKAIIFKDGQQYECVWTADRNTPPKLTDAEGNEIPLNPGRTWIEVPTPQTPITIE